MARHRWALASSTHLSSPWAQLPPAPAWHRGAALCAAKHQQHVRSTALPGVLTLPSASTGMNSQLVLAGFRVRLLRGVQDHAQPELVHLGRAPAVFYAARAGRQLQQRTAAIITQPDKSHTGKSWAQRGVGQLLSPWASGIKGTMPRERDCVCKIGFMKRFYHLVL